MAENSLSSEEYAAAIEQISLLTEQLENAEPSQREDMQSEINHNI
jgi:hypothetical protein